MEPNETHHHPHHHHLSSSSYFTTTPTPATTTPSPTNGLLQPAPHDTGGGGATHMVYPHSVGPSTAAVSSAPVEPPKRKRGRPRKYGTPEQALAAKKTASSSANSVAARERREAAAAAASSPPSSSRKSQQLVALGNTGQGFTSHVISVAAGEDVAQKIMMLMGQSSREMCILSASGSISNASLRQPATSGGSIAYEGRFEIISLSGSYVRTEFGGRTGGLSVCLSNTDGQIIGGGIGGPLTAGGPVQVIIGTFVLDNKKDVGSGVKVDASTSKLPSPVGGASISNIGFRSPAESSGRNPFRANDDHQTIGGNPFLIPSRGMHDWGSGPEARANATFDLTGRTSHGGRQSPENGDYEQYPD